MISITLLRVDGTEVLISIDPSWTVRQLKQEVKRQRSWHVNQQRLIHRGTQLDDNRLVTDYIGSSVDDSVLHLVLRDTYTPDSDTSTATTSPTSSASSSASTSSATPTTQQEPPPPSSLNPFSWCAIL